ncbi:hypothetical protein MAP00_005189 [Monascus purpureus]|nr:hypothetical protein MAP00_005189 [Monascus purpureus]
MVLEYRKPWQWSKLSYIKQKIVPNDQLVMRMMLAISASEIHQRKRDEITANGTSSDIGLAHYSLAVKDLSMSLAQKSYGNEKQRLESLLPALFFMIEYEVRFGYSRRHLRLHLEGVRSLYNSYESMLLNTALENGEQHQTGTRWGGQVDDGLSFLSSQILLWISYLDVIGGQGLCSRSLMTRMSESAVPQLKIELLYRKSRLAGRHIWAGEYPENEVLDDIENYRPLELLHLNNLLRSRIWQLGVSRSEGQQTEDSPEMLMEDLTKIADKYQDILMTASLPATGQTRRVFHTMRCAASSYWAQILFYYRMFDCSQTQTQVAINNILQITRTDYERGRRFLAPHTWALLMAGLQTRDTACRAWILARIQDLSGLHSESPLVTEALQDAMRSGKTDTLDLMTLFRSGCG